MREFGNFCFHHKASKFKALSKVSVDHGIYFPQSYKK